MVSDGLNHCKSSLGFEDNRREGEILVPSRFPLEVINKMKKSMGDYTWSSQYLQHPFIKSGGLFKRDCFNFISSIDRSLVVRQIISIDLAFSEGKNCYTALVVMNLMKDETVVVENVIRFQHATAKREALMLEFCQRYPDAAVVIESQPTSNSKDLENMQSRNLAGFAVHFVKSNKSKELRAEPSACALEAGNIYLVKADWNTMLIDEMIAFPFGSTLDMCDSFSQGYNFLFAKKKLSRSGIW